MPRTARTRWRVGLTATALLMAAALVPAPAHAEDVTDYAITVDPSAKGAAIDDTMYGVFFEDINRAADGGLYAEPCRTAPSSTPPPTTAPTRP